MKTSTPTNYRTKDGQTVTIKRCHQCGLQYETPDPWSKCCAQECLSKYLTYLNAKEPESD